MNIAVAGTGYVGLSIATLLAQHNHVTAVDVIPEKVALINQRRSPIQDEYIEKYFAEKELDLTATLDGAAAYKDAEFVVIAAPTNYDSQKNFFDTSHVEEVIDLVLSVNPDAVMVIKSSKNIHLHCVVCGSDSDFEYNEDKTFVKCIKCNREYLGGYDELVELNKGLIDEELEQTKEEIACDIHKDLTTMLKKAFKGNKFIKIK